MDFEKLTAEVIELLEKKKYVELRYLLLPVYPADIAALFDDLKKEQWAIIFRLLPKELAADVFVYLDGDAEEYLIKAFSDSELKEVLDELFLDDTVDIIEEMPANVVKRIMKQTDERTRRQINELLNYPEDSAGSIMTTEYVDLKTGMTVSDAFTRIRRTGIDKETIYTCYVTDVDRKLLGLISVKTLLLSDTSCLIGDIMETNIISVVTTEDKENVAHAFDKYDFLAIPVVDKENRLVGIVTIDDAMDVIQDENTEDIEKMAAIIPSDKPYFKVSVFETWKARFPWQMLLMVSATFTGQIINTFESALASAAVLMAYIPMLMDTGGNAGSQSSVTIIRGISLGDVEFSDIFRALWKEFRVSLLCGLTLAAANFAKLYLIDRLLFGNTDLTIPVICVVCLTLFGAVVIAKLVGCVLPLFAKKFGFDPAVMASPFITTIVDAVSLIVYFNVASAVLHI